MAHRFLLPIFLFAVLHARAQQPHQHMHTPDTINMQEHPMMHGEGDMMMPSAFSKNLPMAFNGSGTSWHPANSPMYMHMWHKEKWHFMLHYGAFFRYSVQNIGREDGQRGGSAFDVPNWVMLMTTRPVGRNGHLLLRGMFSADAATVGGAGYPLLFQSGESWNGKPLIDYQHPHEVVSELSVGYSQAFSPDVDVYVYAGLPGEPAIGPPAFMHRPSALGMAVAPISHHWQDATHVTFGVGTLGFRYRMMKVEGSIFTGREPDETRYDFDKPRFDSYSARVSVNPAKSLAFQASYGWIESPEALRPEEDIERWTTSALHNAYFGAGNILSSAFVWGLNRVHEPGETTPHNSHSLLAETNWQLPWYSLSARAEWVQKSEHELSLPEETGHTLNDIGAFTLGASRYLSKGKYFWLDLGVAGTVYAIPETLERYYGDMPVSMEVTLRVVPPRMR